jgi:hypothetical protein
MIMVAALNQETFHSVDEQCRLGDDGCCVGCGVAHGDPCGRCGGRGFHRDGCSKASYLEADDDCNATDESACTADHGEPCAWCRNGGGLPEGGVCVLDVNGEARVYGGGDDY